MSETAQYAEIFALLRKTPQKCVVRPIAEKLVGGIALSRGDVDTLVSFLGKATHWNAASACLACVCLSFTDPSEEVGKHAAICLHNVLDCTGAEGNRTFRAGQRTLKCGFWIALTTLIVGLVVAAFTIHLPEAPQPMTKIAVELGVGVLIAAVATLTIGVVIVCCVIAPLTAPLSHYVDNRIRAYAALALEAVGSPLDIEPLCGAMHSLHSELVHRSRNALSAVLARTTTENCQSVSARAIDALGELLGQLSESQERDVIRVLGLCAGPHLIPLIRRIANTTESTIIQSTAENAIIQIEDRARRSHEQATLLRPSNGIDGSLLRPAVSSVTPEEQLLRATDG